MLSLYELCAEASLRDLYILKHCTKIICKPILYDLVRKCFMRQKKKLAFQVLFHNWPYNIFAVQAIGIKLEEEDVLIIASSVQQGQFGLIKHLDLVHKDFGSLDKRATDAFLKVLTDPDPLLSTSNYAGTNRVSFSYHEAVQYAENCVYHGDKSKENISGKRKIVTSNHSCNKFITLESCGELTIYLELVVNSTNHHKVMDVLNAQNHQEENKPFVKISTVRLAFEYVPAQEITKVLEISNCEEVCGIDLSFNCLSSLNSERLMLVSEALKRFRNVENICFAYNGIDPSECHILTNCLKLLPKLRCLDLSWNRLGKSLAGLFTSDLQATNLYELVLTGCDITRSVLNALADCCNLSNLCKLKLDQNNFSGKRRDALIRALVKFKASLKYLDISCCGFDKEDILYICSVFTDFKELHCLLVYPNPGVTPEVIKLDVLPLLIDLPNLKILPPIIDFKEINVEAR